MKNVAVIPTYEPDSYFEEVVGLVARAGFDIVVVNDGSDERFDDIFAAAEKLAHVITYRPNRGKGHALKTAFKYIQEHYDVNDTVVVTMDSDGQHRVKDAVAVCREAAEFPGTLQLGSRSLGKNIPPKSRMGNDATRVMFRIATKVRLYDTQTGLRAFTADLIPHMLDAKGERYEYEMNMLMHATAVGIKIGETPIETVYINNNAATHFRAFKDTFRIHKEMYKFMFTPKKKR